MNHLRQNSLFAALTLGLLFPLTTAGFAKETVRNGDWAMSVVPSVNLYRITPTFFRSAQIRKDDVKAIRLLGIKTIVSLRAFHSDRNLPGLERIKLVGVPMNTWHIEDEDIIAALRAIRSAEKHGPVLLHCQHGSDRTGVVTAMYRVVFQKWSRKKALDELQSGGFGYHAIWTNIPRYLRMVDIDKIRQAVN
ncbi:UNVERIFIED_ORG: protein tyrosine/serine phosphatase [Rhizobium esperanzae]|nr:protein tyrosine/serine phosphatase [Rhizobium etli CNPAF512]